jgi:hypothetical protein
MSARLVIAMAAIIGDTQGRQQPIKGARAGR